MMERGNNRGGGEEKGAVFMRVVKGDGSSPGTTPARQTGEH